MLTLSERSRRCPLSPVGMEGLRSFSISHRTAPFADLEGMALTPAALAELHRRFQSAGLEAVVVSTCNRTELYSFAADAGHHEQAERLFLAAGAAPARERFEELHGLEAAAHLFRVAAGLESMALGEAEVLAQVRESIQRAEESGTAGIFLTSLFRAALRFGGRARSETGIGTGALSIASSAVQLVGLHHPELSRVAVMVVGAGVTGRKVARHLRAERVGRLLVANRTVARAEAAAGENGGEAIGLDEVEVWLPRVQAVVVAAHCETPLLTPAMLPARVPGEAPLVLVDLSLPRAIDPGCAEHPGVAVHDIAGLDQIVAANRARREREVPKVLALLDQELAIFAQQACESRARPLVAALRRRAEDMRREEIERGRREGLSDGALLEAVTRRLVDRLLQAPSHALRRGDLVLDAPHARYLRLIFGLEDSGAKS